MQAAFYQPAKQQTDGAPQERLHPQRSDAELPQQGSRESSRDLVNHRQGDLHSSNNDNKNADTDERGIPSAPERAVGPSKKTP